MNFNVIGAGGGGPAAAASSAAVGTRGGGAGGGGGGGFSLKRKRFRLVSGAWRSAESASRCTSGASSAWPPDGPFRSPRPPELSCPCWLDAAEPTADVPGHSTYTPYARAPSATTTPSSSNSRRFLVSTARLPVVRGHFDRQLQRPVHFCLLQRHIVHDDEFGCGLEFVQEPPDTQIVAFEHHPRAHASELRVFP